MFSRRLMTSLLIAAIVPSTSGCDPVLEQRERDGLQVAPFAPREYIRIRQAEEEDAVTDQMSGEN